LLGAFDKASAKNWERLLAVREEVLKALEQARAAKAISGALEARVTLGAEGNLAALLKQYSGFLPSLFIVSQVVLTGATPDLGAPSSAMEGLRIGVERAQGKKCERCWNYSTRVGENAEYPTVCERCVVALVEIERDRASEAVKS
jgi:isoleucyl-tRNA synthetase